MIPPLLEVADLEVHLSAGTRTVHAVRGVSYSLEPGKVLALVGESGCGKTISALAQVGLITGGEVTTGGSARFAGRDLLQLTPRELRSVRGREIGVVFQDPLSALHPSLTIGAQLAEAIRAHAPAARGEVRARAVELLERMRLPEARRRLHNYPHELSGGQRQRVMIAIALAGRPRLLIADEPTTALDVTVQAEIIALLRELQVSDGLAILMITHDLGLVGELADDVAVMYAGRIVERGSVDAVLAVPGHPYTQALWRARPRLGTTSMPVGLAGKPPPLTAQITGCAFAPRCPRATAEHFTRSPLLEPANGDPRHLVACLLPSAERRSAWESPEGPDTHGSVGAATPASPRAVASVRSLTKLYAGRRPLTGGRTPAEPAVADLDLDLFGGETLGLVGSSGCGKSTLARMLLGLVPASSGSLQLDGTPLNQLDSRARARIIQLVFQDPYASLNPRRPVGESIADPLRALPRPARTRRVNELLDRVGLDPSLARRMPVSLSGGERQRVALARALAPDPVLLVADEPVTALDASVQALVLGLLAQHQRETGLAILLIAHDLAVVAALAHRIAVMDAGRIVELGAASEVLGRPQHATTRQLLDAVPRATRA